MPERQRVRAGGGVGPLVEQRELVAEQVVGGRFGSAESSSRSTASQACTARSSEQPLLAQRRVGVHGVGLADRAELAAPLVQHQPHARERLEPAAEARAHPPHALGHRPHAAAIGV